MATWDQAKLYRAGRPPLSQLSVVTVTGTHFPAPEVVQASEVRIGLVFFAQSASSYLVFLNPQASTPGIFLTSGQAPFAMFLEEHGSIVQQAWFGASISSFANITFLEIFPADAYMDSPFPPAPPEPDVW